MSEHICTGIYKKKKKWNAYASTVYQKCKRWRASFENKKKILFLEFNVTLFSTINEDVETSMYTLC